MPLYNLVYISIETHHLSDQELIDILAISRANNAKLGITGMLLYRKDMFIQVLEGQRELVLDVFQKIRRDTRHRNVHILYEDFIEKRAFENWTMGFNHVVDVDEKYRDSIIDFLASDDPYEYLSSHDGFAMALLSNFIEGSML